MSVSGKDAEVFLEHLVVADLRKLQLGEGMLVHYQIHFHKVVIHFLVWIVMLIHLL